MTESTEPVSPTQPAEAVPPPYGAAPTGMVAPAAAAAAPYGYQAGAAPIGKIRSTGTCILLTVVTLGFYTWYWYYKTHEEMKAHSGQGVGGPIALLLAALVGIVMPFITPNEVGGLYERRGQKRPVSASTGLWYLLLGWFFFVGAIVWFVKTNGALNDYWRSVGATED
ncbi:MULTISPECIES: DUF4234 domain-containing protein [unclassified Nocardioides]|uniref:DUF4234 domain-containing protein n=1 Tax=unclassified Nocardioides TaxID=2615069 RepID=UPI001A991E9E|nr:MULTISPECIES: DUF4234 domain-containing protein [unclassified Nocardioides]